MTKFPTRVTAQKFYVILADPAWQYTDKAQAGKRGASFKYPTMSVNEIAKLDVKSISQKNAVLLLWATPPMIREALLVMEAWGFNYTTFAFVWVKKSKKGTNKMGMGSTTRANAEVVLIGKRGKPTRKSASVRQIIESIPREHSRKPDEIYDRIEKLYGKKVRKIELFARYRRKGWTSWGNGIRYRKHI